MDLACLEMEEKSIFEGMGQAGVFPTMYRCTSKSTICLLVLLAMYTGTAWSGRRAKLADPLTVAAHYMHGAREGQSGRGQVCGIPSVYHMPRACALSLVCTRMGI